MSLTLLSKQPLGNTLEILSLPEQNKCEIRIYLIFTSVELTFRIFIGIADPVPKNTISG